MRKKTFLYLLTSLLVLTSTVFVLAAPSAAAEDGVSYINENGILNTQNNVTVIDNTYFAAPPYALDDMGVSGGWYLVRGAFTLGNVITVTGNVRLILEDNCDLTVNGTANTAGINVTGTNRLTIYAQSTGGNAGALTANGNSVGAGIGGNVNTPGGMITINGGMITATAGATNAAGIGGAGAVSAPEGTIVINGGTVVATSSGGAAGIGSSTDSPGGTIMINGGNVTAYGSNYGPGIGIGGYVGPTTGKVIITGGTVKAYGGGYAAGIGGGYIASGGTILIYGEGTNVTAVGGASAAHDIGAGAGPFSNNFELFAMLPYGNLIGAGDVPIGNTVLFTADPLTVVGVVTATLPAPFNIYGPASDGVIPLITGLGPDAFTAPSEMRMSLLTTFAAQSVAFTLEDYSNSPESRTGTQLKTAGVSVDFFDRSYYEVTVNIVGSGSVEVSDGVITYGTVTPATSGVTFRIPGSVFEIILTATAGTGYSFNTFTVNGVVGSGSPLNVAMDSDKLVVGVFAAPPPGGGATPRNYITAASDAGSTITPEGKISVLRYSNQTFVFSAKAGYIVSGVTVDGVPLTAAQVASGSYTFYNIVANHTINVTSRAASTNIILQIDVREGSGGAEYSVNGAPFITYTRSVALPESCSLEVRAVADDGYKFVKWVKGSNVYTESQIPFGNVTASVYLELYFDGGSHEFPWWILVAILLIVLVGLLLWFIFFYRRYVEVHIHESGGIEGAERVHRKSPYTFTMKDGYRGAASYRIGEDGDWKQVFPDAEGRYLIPRGETVDDIYLERR